MNTYLKYLKMLLVAGLFLTVGFDSVFTTYKNNQFEFVDGAVSKSVLRLSSSNSRATGFVIMLKDKKYVLTNHHVCEGSSELRGQNGTSFYDLKVLYSEQPADLCVLSFNGELPSLRFYPYKNSYVKVYKTLGHPLGFDQVVSSGTLIQPYLHQYPLPYTPDRCPVPTTKTEDVQNPGLKMLMYFLQLPDVCMGLVKMNMYKLDTFPGNSGSPLYDGLGYTHGIISMAMGGVFGIAVSTEEIQAFLTRYEKTI